MKLCNFLYQWPTILAFWTVTNLKGNLAISRQLKACPSCLGLSQLKLSGAGGHDTSMGSPWSFPIFKINPFSCFTPCSVLWQFPWSLSDRFSLVSSMLVLHAALLALLEGISRHYSSSCLELESTHHLFSLRISTVLRVPLTSGFLISLDD